MHKKSFELLMRRRSGGRHDKGGKSTANYKQINVLKIKNKNVLKQKNICMYL